MRRPQLWPDPVAYWPPPKPGRPHSLKETMTGMISFTRDLLVSVCNGFWTLCWTILFSPFSLFLRFGRHPVLILSVLFMLVFGLSVAFSVNVTMFSTLRFFEGFCLAGLALSLYVLSKYTLSPPRAFLLISPSCISSILLCSSLCVSVHCLSRMKPFLHPEKQRQTVRTSWRTSGT